MQTKLLARILGLWLLIAVLGLMATRQTSLDMLNGFFSDAPLMWITGVFTLLIGIVIVVLHNRWNRGALAAIASLYGWIALIKGASFVWLPPAAQAAFYRAMHLDQFYYAYLCVALVIGAYLTYGGFRADRSA